MKFLTLLAVPAALALAACASMGDPIPATAFMANLRGLCGHSYAGHVAQSEAVDASYRDLPMTMGPVACSVREVRIPYAIGPDASRTWVISREGRGLRLRHLHQPADGSVDPVSDYGGVTTTAGTAESQDFPIDAASKALVTRQGLMSSVDNVWTVEVHPGASFAYVLRRPDRHLRVEFDLTRPLP